MLKYLLLRSKYLLYRPKYLLHTCTNLNAHYYASFKTYHIVLETYSGVNIYCTDLNTYYMDGGKSKTGRGFLSLLVKEMRVRNYMHR